MPADDFATSVFINCPFDKDFAPLLNAILFVVTYLGFRPRIATEANDGATVRLLKIQNLIESCRFSIHDLSRCQATKEGEHFRLNMPFELGIDYGCRQFKPEPRYASKRLLILEERPYRYQAAISDLAGCDIKSHAGTPSNAIRQVRNWLVSEANLQADGATRILGAFVDFQAWTYEKKVAAGFSAEDMEDYPISEMLKSMFEWVRAKGV